MQTLLQTTKTLIIFGFTFISLSAVPAFAMVCDDLSIIDDAAAAPEQILCPIARVINIFLGAAVAVLVIMLLFGGLKLALSMGDPKAFQAATSTWTWAIIGFLVVVGSIFILGLVARLVGWDFNFARPYDFIYYAIQDIRQEIGIIEGDVRGPMEEPLQVPR